MSSDALADGMWRLGALPGVSANLSDNGSSDALFYGALTGEALFSRPHPLAPRWGVRVEVATLAFDDLRAAPEFMAVWPLRRRTCLAAALGPLVVTDLGHTRGGAATAFGVGFRSFNYHGSYNLAAGVLVGVHQTFGAGAATSPYVALDLDLAALALPFMLLISKVRG